MADPKHRLPEPEEIQLHNRFERKVWELQKQKFPDLPEYGSTEWLALQTRDQATGSPEKAPSPPSAPTTRGPNADD